MYPENRIKRSEEQIFSAGLIAAVVYAAFAFSLGYLTWVPAEATGIPLCTLYSWLKKQFS